VNSAQLFSPWFFYFKKFVSEARAEMYERCRSICDLRIAYTDIVCQCVEACLQSSLREIEYHFSSHVDDHVLVYLAIADLNVEISGFVNMAQ